MNTIKDETEVSTLPFSEFEFDETGDNPLSPDDEMDYCETMKKIISESNNRSKVTFYLKSGKTIDLDMCCTAEDFLWAWKKSRAKLPLYAGNETYIQIKKRDVSAFVVTNI